MIHWVRTMANGTNGTVVDPRAKLSLAARVSSSDPGTEYLWSCITEDLSASVLGDFDGLYLTLSSGTLEPGRDYAFRFRALNSVGHSTHQVLVLRAGTPPSNGRIRVNPPNGTALQTNFTLEADAWSDDASSLPLTYQFSYTNPEDGVESLLSSASSATVVHSVLPASTSDLGFYLALRLVVANSIGASVAVNTSVRVDPANPSAILSLVSQQVDQALAQLGNGGGVQGAALFQSSAVVLSQGFQDYSSLGQSTFNTTAAQQTRTSMIRSLSLLEHHPDVGLAASAALAYPIVDAPLNAEDGSYLLQSIERLAKNATEGLAAQPTACAASALTALSQLWGTEVFSGVDQQRRHLTAMSALTPREANDALHATVLAVHKLLALDMVPGEPAVDSTSSKLSLRTQILNSKSFASEAGFNFSIPAPPLNGASATYTLPRTLFDDYAFASYSSMPGVSSSGVEHEPWLALAGIGYDGDPFAGFESGESGVTLQAGSSVTELVVNDLAGDSASSAVALSETMSVRLALPQSATMYPYAPTPLDHELDCGTTYLTTRRGTWTDLEVDRFRHCWNEPEQGGLGQVGTKAAPSFASAQVSCPDVGLFNMSCGARSGMLNFSCPSFYSDATCQEFDATDSTWAADGCTLRYVDLAAREAVCSCNAFGARSGQHELRVLGGQEVLVDTFQQVDKFKVLSITRLRGAGLGIVLGVLWLLFLGTAARDMVSIARRTARRLQIPSRLMLMVHTVERARGLLASRLSSDGETIITPSNPGQAPRSLQSSIDSSLAFFPENLHLGDSFADFLSSPGDSGGGLHPRALQHVKEQATTSTTLGCAGSALVVLPALAAYRDAHYGVYQSSGDAPVAPSKDNRAWTSQLHFNLLVKVLVLLMLASLPAPSEYLCPVGQGGGSSLGLRWFESDLRLKFVRFPPVSDWEQVPSWFRDLWSACISPLLVLILALVPISWLLREWQQCCMAVERASNLLASRAAELHVATRVRFPEEFRCRQDLDVTHDLCDSLRRDLLALSRAVWFLGMDKSRGQLGGGGSGEGNGAGVGGGGSGGSGDEQGGGSDEEDIEAGEDVPPEGPQETFSPLSPLAQGYKPSTPFPAPKLPRHEGHGKGEQPIRRMNCQVLSADATALAAYQDRLRRQRDSIPPWDSGYSAALGILPRASRAVVHLRNEVQGRVLSQSESAVLPVLVPACPLAWFTFAESEGRTARFPMALLRSSLGWLRVTKSAVAVVLFLVVTFATVVVFDVALRIQDDDLTARILLTAGTALVIEEFVTGPLFHMLLHDLPPALLWTMLQPNFSKLVSPDAEFTKTGPNHERLVEMRSMATQTQDAAQDPEAPQSPALSDPGLHGQMLGAELPVPILEACTDSDDDESSKSSLNDAASDMTMEIFMPKEGDGDLQFTQVNPLARGFAETSRRHLASSRGEALEAGEPEAKGTEGDAVTEAEAGEPEAKGTEGDAVTEAAAAIKLQAAFRGYSTRSLVEAEAVEGLLIAAQARCRGFLTRKKLKKRATSSKDEAFAALGSPEEKKKKKKKKHKKSKGEKKEKREKKANEPSDQQAQEW